MALDKSVRKMKNVKSLGYTLYEAIVVAFMLGAFSFGMYIMYLIVMLLKKAINS